MNYTVFFLLFSVATLLVMKLMAYLVAKSKNQQIDTRFFYMTPILCPKTHGESFDINIKNSQIIYEILFSTLALIFLHNYLLIVITEFPIGEILRPYFLLCFVYTFTLFLGANFRALSVLFKFQASRIHNRPYLSKSLFEFWSLRWNIWIRNWLLYMGKSIAPNNITLRQFLIFAISGLFHEVMINTPYYLYTGETLFGSMMLYFLIQYFGIIVDTKYLKSFPRFRYIFMWLVIMLPAPFFMNKALMLFFGFM